ncbi:protein ABHD13-like [Watersipora subatra]|uniref:protein ABHD13-like n=1 Tax=Watersipora subatra TaxID=2589382 RepID=UPI00355B6475
MPTSIGMYLKRLLYKIRRILLKSTTMVQLQAILMKTPLLYQFSERLPSLCLLIFSFYLGCGIYSIFLDLLILLFTLWTIAVLLYNAQDKLLYFPCEPETSRVYVPRISKISDCESITITSSDGTLIHAFLLKHSHPIERPTVIFYHGNAGNIGYRMENGFHLMSECGVNVLLMEYRGYGLSGGEISEQGIYSDALAAVKYVKNRVDLDSSKVVIMGRSLGGAIAIETATHPECSDIFALILENTFTSLPDIAKRVLNISLIKMVPEWCYKNRYKSLDKIRRVRQPTLFLSGRSDTLIPPTHMDSLYLASGSTKKEMSSFPDGDHNSTWTEPGYFFAVKSFLQSL